MLHLGVLTCKTKSSIPYRSTEFFEVHGATLAVGDDGWGGGGAEGIWIGQPVREGRGGGCWGTSGGPESRGEKVMKGGGHSGRVMFEQRFGGGFGEICKEGWGGVGESWTSEIGHDNGT